MSLRTLIRKLSCQTVDLMGSGGGGYGALSLGDLQAVLSTCDSSPLIESYLFAKEGLTDHIRLENMLVPWLLQRLHDKYNGMNLNYIAKNHGDALNAAIELSEPLAKYLSRHRVSKDKFGTYFKIEKSKLSRYYAPFIRGCVCDLEAELNKLERQIKNKLRNNND